MAGATGRLIWFSLEFRGKASLIPHRFHPPIFGRAQNLLPAPAGSYALPAEKGAAPRPSLTSQPLLCSSLASGFRLRAHSFLPPGASGLSKSFPFPWLVGPWPQPTLAQQHKVAPALAAAAQGDSHWLQLLLSPGWRDFQGGKHCPPLTPLHPRMWIQVPSSYFFSFAPKTGLKLLSPVLKAKK